MSMKRATYLLSLALLVACGKNNAASSPTSERNSAASSAKSDLQEHAPKGDPASLPKIAADEQGIRKMIRERFGDATARNLRIAVGDQGGGKRVEISGEVPSDEIKQGLVKELEARLTDMKSEDFSFTLPGPLRQVFTFDAFLQGGGSSHPLFSRDLSLFITPEGYIYEVATGRLINRMILPSQANDIRSMAISPDNKTLAMGFDYAQIFLFDLPLGRNMRVLSPKVEGGHNMQRIAALEFLPDSKHLVAINANFGDVLVYDLEKGFSRTVGSHTRKDSGGPPSDMFLMAVSPDGKQAASITTYDSAVSVWDIETKSRKMLDAKPIAPTAIAWSHNGKTIAVARGTGDKRGAVLLDVASGKGTVLTNEQDDIIQSLAFSPDDKTLAVAGQNNGTVLWDLRNNKPWQTLLQEKASSGFADRFSPDGTTLATDCETLSPTCARLWDVSKRPGGSRGAGHLPPALDVKTYQDDQLTKGLEDDFARTFNIQGPNTIKVSLRGDGALVLDGTVRAQRDQESATRIAENFYVGLKPANHNKVINNLQVAGRGQ